MYCLFYTREELVETDSLDIVDNSPSSSHYQQVIAKAYIEQKWFIRVMGIAEILKVFFWKPKAGLIKRCIFIIHCDQVQ